MAEYDKRVSDLLRNMSPDVRAMTVRKFSAEFVDEKLSGDNRAMAEAIFRASLGDESVDVRKAMSGNFKRCANVPHDIIVILAKDVPEVAVPILKYSPVLTDIDLKEIVTSMELDHQLAIAKRKRLSEAVTEVLAETEDQTVVKALTSNSGAKIAPITYHKIIYIFPEEQSVLSNIVRRPSLPKRTVRELFRCLSGDLLAELEQRYPRPKEFDEEKVGKMSDNEIFEMVEIDDDPYDIDDLLHEVNRIDRLSPKMVVQSMCLGDFKFFENAMAELAGIRLENARILIFDGGSLGLDALQEKTRFPHCLMDVVRLLVKLSLKVGYNGDPRDHSRYYLNAIRCLDKKYKGEATRDLNGLLGRLAQVEQNPEPQNVWSEMRSSARD